jgi:hypothetical protein
MQMKMQRPRLLTSIALILLSAPVTTPRASETKALFYERDVRPILKTHCFQCHGEGGHLEGGLDLRLRRLISAGGDSGVAIVPGAPAESLLLQRLRSGEMPPEEVELRPDDHELATIERWISGGAAARRDEPEDLDPDNYITEEERAFWAFQPVKPQRPPVVNHRHRVRTTIDRFLLAKLESRQLSFSADADRSTLIRRAYFDLLGLPPTPEAVARFVQNDSPAAYNRLLDRLLSSSYYGERWARHWLDVAGYADSEGVTDDDPVRPDAYKYRNYVIRAFGDDKPFDQFIVEQLAGDELLKPPFENLSAEQAETLVATGFLRTVPDGTGSSGTDQGASRNQVIAKTIQVVSTSLLGLTVGCAQCHDHRYDPISQVDYYAIRAIFEPALDWKNWLAPQKRRVSLYTSVDRARAAEIESEAQKILAQRTNKQEEFIQATLERELAKLAASLRAPIRTARETPQESRTAAQQELLRKYPRVNVSAGSLYLYDSKAADELKKLQQQAEDVRATKPVEEFVRAVWEPAGSAPPKTFLFHRGDHEQPKQEVAPRELTVLAASMPADLPANDELLLTSGRRLAYARWLTSGRHPLVARVMVNRVWLNHFGRGLVASPGDFGALGTNPTHPRLLDWLAGEFVASGWSVKHLHRLIMTSTAYRQSSRRHAAGDGVDTANSLYWRMPLRRLEAEALRDATLAVSGELNSKAFGPAVPVMADRVGQFVIGRENLNAGRPGEVVPMRGEDLRRSIYIQVRRSRPLSVMAPFDLPRMEPNCTVRSVSTVAPQSLLLMNSQFILTRASAFARRVRREAEPDLPSQVALAWQLAFASRPSKQETAAAVAFIDEQARYFAANSAAPSDNKDSADDVSHSVAHEALASFCQALLGSNRFLYVD